MTGALDVRRATPADVPDLVKLVERYWEFERITGFEATHLSQLLTRLLSHPQMGCGWLARVDGMLAGYLLAVFVFSLEHRGLTAEIDEFFVVAEHRGRRIGEALLRAAEAAFVNAGCTNVALQLARDNTSGRAFYRRQGYAERSGYELLDKRLRD